MCNNLDYKLLRVTNRGTNVFPTVADTEYSVNIPSELRIPNKRIEIEVVDGIISLLTKPANFKTYKEVGIECNLCNSSNSYNTEVENSFNCTQMSQLFNVNLQNWFNRDGEGQDANTNINFKKDSSNTFILSSLPEKLIFKRYVNAAGVSQNLTEDNYIQFTLKITYHDK